MCVYSLASFVAMVNENEDHSTRSTTSCERVGLVPLVHRKIELTTNDRQFLLSPSLDFEWIHLNHAT